MNRCKTCKWWGAKDDPRRMRNCTNSKLDDVAENADYYEPGEFVGDVDINTSPDFGCVLWEKK
jgi:hypothetical protein